MNGFKRSSLALLCLGAGVGLLGGCANYRDYVDPCWPSRYNSMARASTNEVFDAQALNGHIKDQTIWNKFFETEEKVDPKTNFRTSTPTAKLNVAGQYKLENIVRRQPYPDGRLFLQTAYDLPRDWPLEKIAETRARLDRERVEAVEKYLAALTVSRTDRVNFTIVVNDLAEPSIPALPISGATRPTPTGAIPDNYEQFKGSIPISPLFGSGGGSSSGGG